MKNITKKAIGLALCLAMLFSFGLSVWAENIDEAWDIGDNYVFYGTYVYVGEESYELSQLYDYTLFAFMPEETGKYTFSVEGGEVGIVSYNAMWVSIQPSEATVTADPVSWECTGVGQEIWIAVKADAAAATIKVESSASERVVIEKIEYVNKTTPEAFVFPGDVSLLKSVNVRNSTIDEPVLGDDGYYHLNSEDGYIIYVNLSDGAMMSLSSVAGVGQLKGATYNEDGVLTTINDYNVAFNQYLECADPASSLYPLTDDLIEILKEVGKNMSWYGADGWLGLSKDDAWMYCCYYTEEEFNKVLPGDINGDGYVTSVDSNILCRAILGTYYIDPDSDQMKAADINGDEKLAAIDSNLIKRIISGLM